MTVPQYYQFVVATLKLTKAVNAYLSLGAQWRSVLSLCASQHHLSSDVNATSCHVTALRGLPLISTRVFPGIMSSTNFFEIVFFFLQKWMEQCVLVR